MGKGREKENLREEEEARISLTLQKSCQKTEGGVGRASLLKAQCTYVGEQATIIIIIAFLFFPFNKEAIS